MAMIPVPNGSFETGDFSEWEVLQGNPGQINVTSDDRAPYDGTYGLAVRSNGEIVVRNTNYLDVIPGDVLNVSCMMMPTRGSDRGTVRVWWYDASDAPISPPYVEAPHNTPGHVAGTGDYRRSFLNNLVVPSNARRMRVGFYARKYTESSFGVDYFLVESTQDRTITLVAPSDGSEWEEGSTIQLRADVGGTRPAVQRVEYFVNNVSVGSVTSSPWALNYLNAPTGTYKVFARLHYGSGATLDSDVHTFIVEEELPPPDTREYNASNAYTQLVLENFAGLGSQIPSTAQITGLEIMVDYKLSVLSRTKDLAIEDPANANDLAPFDLVPRAALEVVMIDNAGDRSVVGSPETVVLPIDRSDFDIVETGISDGKKWTVRESETLYSASVGGENILWGSDVIAFPDFVTRSLGVRFVLQPGSKPDYADAGDAVFRFFIDRIRIRAHFDAGSVEYYFASPDKDQIIKGTLVAGNVLSGNLRTGDAGGILQLLPELEVMDGDQQWIGNDWTIHSAYPPTDLNKIGDVGNIEGEDAVGMEYNSLPTQHQIRENRSRYQMISANFYGDKGLISIYGANGLSRAFAHNGEWFYKIYTQPDPEKDRPRHVAYHHWHLALGYEEGRVDISVVGEPYNFDGALGASSWTIGDQVVGLLPLSGTILGVFGGKSVWGISGTTVDNFATQVISPNIGATEYTITDMGFPVYANAYGIYTLSQTQEYGDYLGTPMSQDVSPWLRPRLVRKYTSDREVEVAWPVRSKNQYRLAFSDGYILSMTMNGQAIPTFSKQKYFIMPQGGGGDGWTPIADSSVDFTFNGAEGISMEGSTVIGAPTGMPIDQIWTVSTDRPVRMRLVVEEYSSGYYWDSSVLFGGINGELFTNGSSANNQWIPNPMESSGEVSSVMYMPGTASDYPADSYRIIVEVWEEPSECEIRYDYESIVPAAVSSQLDVTGEERIHMAPAIEIPPPPPPPPPRPDPLYVTSTEDVSAFAVNWPEGYNYDSTIEIYKDGNFVGELEYYAYDDSITFAAGTVWYGSFHEQINQGDIVTLKQGDWEAEMYIETNVPLVIEFRPSQTFPIASSWESDLMTYTNTYMENSAVLRLDGSEYTASFQRVGGTYTWVYDQDFPTEITEWTEAEVSIDGGEFVPAYIIAATWYPSVSIRTSSWDGSEYRTAVEMYGQKWGGFDAQEDTYFTLERDGVVYTFTKGAYSLFWCDVNIDTAPIADENNPWLMGYEAGSYLVTVGGW